MSYPRPIQLKTRGKLELIYCVKKFEHEGGLSSNIGEVLTFLAPKNEVSLQGMLLNSMIHRQYIGSFTQIRVYDDKINIWNDGGLPENISLESLRRSHPSKPRNLLITEVCFKGGLIDAWGRGTLRIIDACKEVGLPEPELIEQDGGFLVTLFKNNLTEEQLKKLGLTLWFGSKLSVNLTVTVPEKIIISKERVSQFKGWFTR